MYWRLTLIAVATTLVGVAYLSLLPAAEDPASLRNVGRSHYEEENYSEAVKSFQEILSLLPDSAVDEINLGIVLTQLERYPEARRHLERGERLDAKMAPYAAYNLALTYKRERDFANAAAQFERVREMDFNCPDTAYNLAVVYENLGEMDKAFEEASRAVELLPDEIAPHYRRMMIAVRQGKRDIANQEKNRLTELRGQDARNRTPAELEMSRYTEIVEPERGKTATSGPSVHSGVTFSDITVTAGLVPERGWPKGPARVRWVDVNGDTLQDLSVVSAPGGLQVWVNQRPHSFKPIPIGEDLQGLAVQTAHAWGDIDYDGDKDLFVTGNGVVHLLINDGSGVLSKGQEILIGEGPVTTLLLVDYDHDGDLDLYVATGPRPPAMFQNDGRGNFSPVATSSGLSPEPAVGVRLHYLDFDDDNDTDFFLSAPREANLLLSNLRGGSFRDVARKLEVDLPVGNRNVLVTDLNNDEWRDIVFLDETGQLLAAFGTSNGKFTRSVLGRIPGKGSALASFDYDNDGDEDLFAGGRLLQNDGHFVDYSDASGLQSLGLETLVQASPEDLDGDGDLDLAVVHEDGRVRLLRNEGGNRNRWLRVELEALQSNRFGVATKVEVRDASFFQRKIYEGRPLLFGIGQRRDIDVLRLWWPTGVAQNILGPGLHQTITVKEKLGPPSSCPFVYLWDGEQFTFFTDVLDAAALGVPLGNGEFLPYASKEDLLIPGSAMRFKDGKIVVQLTGELREIIYLDAVRLTFFDRPPGTEVYPADFAGLPSSRRSRLLELDDLRPARSAWNARGEDVTANLAKQDGDYVSSGIRLTRFHGLADPHVLVLDLGDLSRFDRPSLLLQGWINWVDGDTLYALSTGAGPTLYGPRLEIQNEGGPWQVVSENIGLPAGIDKHLVVRLPADLCGGNTRVRLSSNLEVYWDRAAVGNLSSGRAIEGGELPLLSSDLHFRGFSRLVRGAQEKPPWYDYSDIVAKIAPWKPQRGLFTRFGDVSSLLAAADDHLVVFGPGDEVTLTFEAPSYIGAAGTVRDYILRLDGWIKDANPSTHTGDRVEPLPTRTMRNYPMDPEPDGGDREYWGAVDSYNTRALPGR